MTLAFGSVPKADTLRHEHGRRFPREDWASTRERCKKKLASYKRAARALVSAAAKEYDNSPFSGLPSAQLLLWLVRDLEAISGTIPTDDELARALNRLDDERYGVHAVLRMCRDFVAGYRDAMNPGTARRGSTEWPTPNPMTPVPSTLPPEETERGTGDRGELIGKVAELSVSRPDGATPTAKRMKVDLEEGTSIDLMQTDVDVNAEALAKARAETESRKNRYRLCEQAVQLWRRGKGVEARRTIARAMSDEPGPLTYLIDLISETENDELVDVLEEIYLFASEPWVKEHAKRTAIRLKGSAD